MRRREFTGALILAGSAALSKARQPGVPRPDSWWEEWRRINQQGPPQIVTDQSGKWELIDLLGKPPEVTKVQQWEAKRRRISQVILEFLGAPPPRAQLKPEIVEEADFATYVRRKVVLGGEGADPIPAYLFVPKRVHQPSPAVICLHQTTYLGKLEAAGIAGAPSLAYASELADRGYVTIAPDQFSFGERHDLGLGSHGNAIKLYQQYPTWSVIGKMIWDVSRAIDYLESLDTVDRTRIACIGHSHGAYGTLFAAAFDQRVRASVESCGFTTFRADGNTFRWSQTPFLLIPRLGFYNSDVSMTWDNFRNVRIEAVKSLPFDFHHLLSLIAPRPLFLSVALQDEIFFRTESVREVVEKVEEVYALYGARDRLRAYFFDGLHTFPKEARLEAYSWLDRQMAVQS